MKLSLVVLYISFLPSVYTAVIDDGSETSSEPFNCSEIPTVENANVSSTSSKTEYTKGDSLIYNCQKGFIGKVIFTCDGNKWVQTSTRNAKCSRKRCGLPGDTPNGRFRLVNGTEFVYESTVQYTCKTGYQMVSLDNTRTCLSDGWSNHLPVCEEITCSPPEVIDNINVDGLPDYDNSPRYGHQLRFSCEPAFKLVGSRDIICGENGKWNNPFPRCEEIICDTSGLLGYVSVLGLPQGNAPIKYGHKLRFSCSQLGMVLKGNKEVTCSAEGQWSSPFPICEEVTCKEEQLNNVKIVNGFPPFKPWHSITFQCIHPQWIMTGQPRITCREDGTWSSPYPTCLENRGCGTPPRVEFADITTPWKPFYSSGERVQYSCQQLYTVYGLSIKTCSQGVWYGDMTCLKPCTVTIQDMKNHHIELQYGPRRIIYAPHADHITFKCQYGRRLSGNVALRQQCINGVMWLPYCI